MTAQEFLDDLQQRAWVPGDVLASLRKQVAAAAKPVAPETLAKLLVSKQRLTAAQAQQLLVAAPQKAAQQPAAQQPAASKSETPQLTAEDLGLSSLLEEELGLAPLDDDVQKPFGPGKTTTAKSAPAVAAPTKATAPSTTAPVKPQTGNKSPAGKPGAAKPMPGKAAPTNATAAKSGSATPAGKAAAGSPGPMVVAGQPAADDPFGLGAFGSNELLSEPMAGDAAASMQGNPLMAGARRRAPVPVWVWLASGGGLLAIIAIVVVLRIVGRNTGDPQWKLAEKDYQAGADQEAIYKLEAFLERFPNHPQASLARVYEGMAQLRMAWAAKTDWEQPLAVARGILPQLVREPEFPKVREDLAKLLPDMAAGLAKQAQVGANASLEQRRRQVEMAEQGFALANDWRFVPAAQKPWPEMHATEDQVAHLARDLARDTEQQQALSTIRAAIDAGKASDGFVERDRLVQDFPELRQDGSLDQLNQELAQASIKLVKIDPQPRTAETKPRGSPIVTTLVYIPRNETAAAGAVGKSADQTKAEPPTSEISAGAEVATKIDTAVLLLVGGTVYWLEPDHGSAVGRQFVGFDSVPPLAIGMSGAKNATPPDAILFDAVHQELVRYAPGGTELRWRLAIGDAVDAPPSLTEKQLVVATRSGKLIQIDAETGKWLRAAQFPVRLRTAPAISADGTTLYLVADAGILYVVSAKDLSVTAAVNLGHASGSVVLSPTVFAQHLVVVENSDWDNSTLRLVRLGTGKNAAKVVQSLALAGQVTSPPVISGSHLFIATNAGAMLVLGPGIVESPAEARSGSESAAPVKGSESSMGAKSGDAPAPVKTAEVPAVAGPPLARFIAVSGNHVWLAGQGAARYELDEASGGLTAGWHRLEDRHVQQPPQLAGDKLIVAAHRPGWPGLWVTAVDAADGRTRWEVVLAAPPVGLPLVAREGGRSQIAHSLAGVLSFESAPVAGEHFFSAAMPTSQIARSGEPSVLVDSIPLADGTLALVERRGITGLPTANGASPSKPTDHLVLADAKSSELRPSPWTDPLASPPAAFAGGLLVANPAGQIGLVNVANGLVLAAPFQPRITPGGELAWCKPAVVPDEREVVLADGAGNVYRLGISDKPVPNLAPLATAKLPSPAFGDVAVCGEFAFVTDAEGSLAALTLTDLKPAKNWPLGGRAVWGPRRVGQSVLVATERELFCIDKRPDLAWHVPLEGGLPVDTPLDRGSEFVMATADGVVTRVDFASGEVRKKVNLEQPLAGGPVASGANLILTGHDGSLFFIKSP